MIEELLGFVRSRGFWFDAVLMWLTLICFVGALQELVGLIGDRRSES